MKYISIGLLVSLILVVQEARAQRSGVEIWVQTCGNCHTNQPTDRYTSDQWKSIMDHMKIYVRLTDAETDAVLVFLQSGARKIASDNVLQPVSLATRSVTLPTEGIRSGPFPSNAVIDVVDAERTFRKLCVACHGENGEGNGVAAPALNPRPADFTSEDFQRTQTDENLASVITDGKGAMPAFKGQLSEGEITELVNYVRIMGEK